MAAASIQEVLADTLNADPNKRMSAELKLAEAFQHQGRIPFLI